MQPARQPGGDTLDCRHNAQFYDRYGPTLAQSPEMTIFLIKMNELGLPFPPSAPATLRSPADAVLLRPALETAEAHGSRLDERFCYDAPRGAGVRNPSISLLVSGGSRGHPPLQRRSGGPTAFSGARP
jgi:hypothetical protein